VEVQRATDVLVELIRRKHVALAHGHENSLKLLDQQINIVFAEKDRVVDALERHQERHGC
jgi:hypothetical protein